MMRTLLYVTGQTEGYRLTSATGHSRDDTYGTAGQSGAAAPLSGSRCRAATVVSVDGVPPWSHGVVEEPGRGWVALVCDVKDGELCSGTLPTTRLTPL